MKSTPIISGRRLWLMRLFAMIFVPILLLGGIELGLRLTGYGYDTHFFRSIQINGHTFYVPNEKFSYRFFPPSLARTEMPIRFAAEKATNSYRIFLFGESAANGDPDSTYGVGRYLEVLLRERYPGTDFQVICVAITAIDSSTILPIARECAGHQGDLWLVYMGNNEMVGPFGAETSYGLRAPNRALIHTILAIKSTRIGQMVDALISHFRSASSSPKKWGGMEMFANNRLGFDDPARLRAYANFKGNLDDILHAAIKAEVPVILSTVAVNLKDCAPFASPHAANLNKDQESAWDKIYGEATNFETAGSYREALGLYQKAALIDPHFAELQFRMGECELALSNNELARKDFDLARDNDALDFRADTRINSAIKEAAANHADHGVHLLDAASSLAQRSPDGIPGLNLFYEHVHLNFAGNYLLALDFAGQVKQILPASIITHDQKDWAPEKLCDARLAVTVWDRQRVWQPIMNRVTSPPFTEQFNHADSLKVYQAKLEEAKSLMKTQTPAQARQMYEEAVAVAPDDYFLHGNFQRFLEKGGYLSAAIVEAKRCCELVPQLPGGFYYVGTLLVREGKTAEASEYFLRALAIRDDYAEAQNGLGEILANQQQPAKAIQWFKRAIRSNPNYVEPYLNLGFLEQNEGKPDAAMVWYQQAAILEPGGPADYFFRANVAASRYQWDGVISCLQLVVKAKPEFWQARYQLGIQLASKGEREEALAQFQETVRLRPDFAPAHLELATTLAANGKPEQALAEFRAVLRLDPADLTAQQQTASLENALNHGH